MFFPEVKKSEINGTFSFCKVSDVCCLCDDTKQHNAVKTVFGKITETAPLILQSFREEELLQYNEEAYRLSISEDNGKLNVKIYFSCDKSFMRALFCIKRMLVADKFALGEILDYPSYKVRGYIEGFYGRPWKSEERLRMLETMALFGENTHYYAPKDDPYHRNKWRELYPEKEAGQLKKLVDKADSLCVDFYYCIAPGLSMKYSDDNDIEALFEKTKQLYSMGIKNFGLLLDDIPSDLFYKEDKEIFNNAANAHVHLVKKYLTFLKTLSADTKLTVCPTAYHGKGNEAELVDFAKNVPGEVSVFFTGDDICSKELRCCDAEVFMENTLHKPLYWDNYPVNDAEMFMEMHIGPVIGREKDLYNYSEGIISNCMEYFYCNYIPLITVAAYLWNPEKYDPEIAYKKAVEYLLPEDERDDFVLLADQFRTSCLHDENSRIMGEYLSAASVYFQTGNQTEAINTVSEYTDKVNLAAGRIVKRTHPIYTELARWIKKFVLMSEIMSMSLDVLAGTTGKEELEKKMSEYNESATVLTSFCFREYIESVLGVYEN